MTDAQRKRAERHAKASLERLLVGWQGALISGSDATIPADTRWRAREACTAARAALQRGVPPHEVVLNIIAPVFVVPSEAEGEERGRA